VNIRETIEQLTAVAEELPDGLDSQVKVHLCNGDHAEGVLTGRVEVYDAGGFAAVRGHPHLDDEDTVVRPLMMGVDDELARLVAGQRIRPWFPLEVGDGTSIRMPIDDQQQPMLPASAAAVAEGCTCDPGDNRRALETARTPVEDRAPGAEVELSFDPDCPFHTRTV
jgi:hypothetical protein